MTWSDGSTVLIMSVKHKYLDAFHSALARFNERFPAAKGLKQVRVTLEGENAFAELTAAVKARADYVDAQTQVYAEGSMSLAMLAFMTGVSVIDVMLGLAEANTPYRVAIGTEQERIDAFKAIETNRQHGCVVDAATLHCIRRLNLENVVQAICGKIGVAQATVDYYGERLHDIEILRGGPGGTMAYRNGRLHLTARSPAETEQTRALIETDLAWVKADPPAGMRRLGMLRGARFFDELYAASGAGRLLLVDDLFTRQVGGQMAVPGAWLQPVLMLARAKGFISRSDYAKAITDMIDAGQAFISIDPQTLIAAHALDRETGKTNAERRIMVSVRCLGGRHADMVSHCRVAIEFLRVLWGSDPLEIFDYAATSELLRALIRERSEDYPAILTTLDNHVRQGAFSIYLRQWARGHFLRRWPNEGQLRCSNSHGQL